MAKTDYRERLNRVRAYIGAHLDTPLNLDELADIACLSRFHWHRVYRGLTGETVWQTVRRLRLQRAALELATGTEPVAKIAERSGYANARAFSKAFRDDYGLPPLRYRAEGGHRRYDNDQWQEHTAMYDVRIETRPAGKVMGLVHTGPYIEISATFDRFGAELAARQLQPESKGMAALYFDDPDITPPEQLRALSGLLLAEGESASEGFETGELPAGRYAILTHKGPYAELGKAYGWFFGAWLSGSGETPAKVPPMEFYLNTPLDAAPPELLTEIHMALV